MNRFRLYILLALTAVSSTVSGQFHSRLFPSGMLSSSLVNDIAFDRNDFLWVATENGLNRYDGVRVEKYLHRKDEPGSIAHNYITHIHIDRKGRLWIGSHEGVQIYRSITNDFSQVAVFEDGSALNWTAEDFLELPNGDMWVCSDSLVSVRVRGEMLLAEKVSLSALRGIKFDRVYMDSHETIWLTSRTSGCYVIDYPTWTIRHFEDPLLDKAIVEGICEDGRGDIFMATLSSGILRYNHFTGGIEQISDPNAFIPRSIYLGEDGLLLIGTDGAGIKTYNSISGEFGDYNFDDSFFNSNKSKVHRIINDKYGNLWLAVYQKGVMFIPEVKSSFHYIGHNSANNDLIGSNCVTSITRGRNGVLWVATDSDGIYGILPDGGKGPHFSHGDPKSSIPVAPQKIFEDKSGKLWVGSFAGGLCTMDSRSGKCTYIPLTDNKGSEVRNVYDFAQDKDGNIWIATLGNGVFMHDPGTNTYVQDAHLNSTVSPWASCIHYSSIFDCLYVGTYTGIYRYDLSPVGGHKIKSALPQSIIHCICEDHKGNLWLGTPDGLVRWDPRKDETKLYNTALNTPEASVNSICESANGRLWIGNNIGLTSFDPSTGDYINFFFEEEIRSNEFSKKGVWVDSDDTIWFGGSNGIVWFRPEDITPTHRSLTPRITDIVMQGSHYKAAEGAICELSEIAFDYRNRTFSIEFSTKQLTIPEYASFKYSLDSDSWIILPPGARSVFLSELKPGWHDFRINVGGLDDSQADSMRIYIKYPWWGKWWMICIYALTVISLLSYFQLQHKIRKKREEERSKARKAEEVSEEKIKFFINMSHEIRTPMSLIFSPLEQLMASDPEPVRQRQYRTIHRNAERILRQINQLMDVRKIEKGQLKLSYSQIDMVGFLRNLLEAFEPVARKKSIDFKLEYEAHVHGWIDIVNFDKVVLNLLSNAFKFTPENGQIRLILSTGSDTHLPSDDPLRNYIRVDVKDSGPGVDPSEVAYIFERFFQSKHNKNNGGTGVGLDLCRQLVTMHKGSISVANNTPEAGCTFTVRLPAGNAHIPADEFSSAKAATPEPAAVLNQNLPSESDAHQRPLKSYRVLVAEDDNEIRAYLEQELGRYFHVTSCEDGNQALEKIFEQAPDLLISDIKMPGMDGFELCSRIKKNINLNTLPIILLTSMTDEQSNLQSLGVGADAFITKPFNLQILLKTAQNLIEQRSRLKTSFAGGQDHSDEVAPIKASTPDDRLMARIMKVINANISNSELSVEMISQEVGISRVHLHRKLKELTNQTTRDFVRNIRLQKAAELLRSGHHSISEVADLTGFNIPNNFSMAFKAFFGETPTQYMERHKTEKETEKENG